MVKNQAATKHEYVESRNVSMYRQDWAIVEALALRMAISTSAALRIIVRQWVKLSN